MILHGFLCVCGDINDAVALMQDETGTCDLACLGDGDQTCGKRVTLRTGLHLMHLQWCLVHLRTSAAALATAGLCAQTFLYSSLMWTRREVKDIDVSPLPFLFCCLLHAPALLLPR